MDRKQFRKALYEALDNQKLSLEEAYGLQKDGSYFDNCGGDGVKAIKIDGLKNPDGHWVEVGRAVRDFQKDPKTKRAYIDTKRKKYAPQVKKWLKENNPTQWYCESEASSYYRADSIVIWYQKEDASLTESVNLSKLSFGKKIEIYNECVYDQRLEIRTKDFGDIFKGFNNDEIFEIMLRSQLPRKTVIVVPYPDSVRYVELMGFVSRKQFETWFDEMLDGKHSRFQEVADNIAELLEDEDAKRYYLG